MSRAKTPLPKRLKAARVTAGLSQKSLGIACDIDEFVASARINQYERGVHAPRYETARRLAKVLKVPTAYLFADDDADAELLLRFHQLSRSARRVVLAGLVRHGK